MSEYFTAKELLAAPAERAAFSDRQAYVCAELSKLAYFKFEGGHTVDKAIELVSQFIDDEGKLERLKTRLKGLFSSASSSKSEAEAVLKEILSLAGFDLAKTFSVRGTQAFLCSRSLGEGASHKLVGYLAFRGTERDFADIKTDIKASFITEQLNGINTRVHEGYFDALKNVGEEIRDAVGEQRFDQLIITGHSLGGALAILYTRLHMNEVNGACYTFGAPPVGGVEFQYFLKTPVYQITNEVDIVPRLPSPFLVAIGRAFFYIFKFLIKIFGSLSRIVFSGKWDEWLVQRLDQLGKYRHPGYMSYLEGSGSESRLRYNVDSWDLMRWWAKVIGKRLLGFKKLAADHSIDVYSEKLKTHAYGRNPPAGD